MDNKCKACGLDIRVDCGWQQGRCPHRTPFLTDYHFRYFNLVHSIRNFFNRKQK